MKHCKLFRRHGKDASAVARAPHEESIAMSSKQFTMLQEELESLKAGIKHLERQYEERLTKLEDDLTMCKETVTAHDESIRALLDPPEVYYCGIKGSYISEGTIRYESLFYNHTNQPTGGLDRNSGLFTAPVPGTYEVNWSIKGQDSDESESTKVYLYKNGEYVRDAFQKPVEYINSPGTVYATVSKTILLYLDVGGSIYLRHTGNPIEEVMFCISLVHYDLGSN